MVASAAVIGYATVRRSRKRRRSGGGSDFLENSTLSYEFFSTSTNKPSLGNESSAIGESRGGMAVNGEKIEDQKMRMMRRQDKSELTILKTKEDEQSSYSQPAKKRKKTRLEYHEERKIGALFITIGLPPLAVWFYGRQCDRHLAISIVLLVCTGIGSHIYTLWYLFGRKIPENEE